MARKQRFRFGNDETSLPGARALRRVSVGYVPIRLRRIGWIGALGGMLLALPRHEISGMAKPATSFPARAKILRC